VRGDLLALAAGCDAVADDQLQWALIPSVGASTVRDRAAAAAALMTCAAALRARAAAAEGDGA
jgi:hypothetical protein